MKFFQRVTGSAAWQGIIKFPDTAVIVALYVATAQAIDAIQASLKELETKFGVAVTILPVQQLAGSLRFSSLSDEPFVKLVERYYDPEVEDDHTKKGGTNLKYGFAACGLPLVLHHNTPNNSLFLLWVEDSKKIHPLFQRFSRHKREA